LIPVSINDFTYEDFNLNVGGTVERDYGKFLISVKSISG